MAEGGDKRSEGRSNVFLSAALDAAGQLYPVRIRNLSAHGAMVDGPVLPPIGTTVRLVRGHLSASGQLAWHGDRRAGINFDDSVDVESWVERIGHSGQQRVDAVVAALRRSEPVPSELREGGESEDLRTLSAELDRVCARLADAAGLSVELGEELLKLDVLAQKLREIATGRKV